MYDVLSTSRLPGKAFLSLSEKARLTTWPGETPPEKQWIVDHIGGMDGLIVTLTSGIDREVIEAAAKLKVISTYSVGYDHIDLAAARMSGITVTNTPGVLTDATADLVFGSMIAVARRIVEGDRLVRSGAWSEPWTPGFMLGSDIHGKTLGLLGAGRIAKAVAVRSEGFGMEVMFHSRSPHHEFRGKRVDLDTLFRKADFLVVAVDLNKETHHIVNKDRLMSMKRGSYLINASRGSVVDEAALAEALREEWLGGAALDVFEREPLGSLNPYAGLDNVVLTPHLGSSTMETRERMTETVVEDLLLCLGGQAPHHRVA